MVKTGKLWWSISIPIVSILFVSLIFWRFCYKAETPPITTIAKSGITYLDSIDFIHTKASYIKGEWAFYPEELLTPEDLLSLPKNRFTSIPWGLKDEKPSHYSYGHGTFQMELVLPENRPPLTLYFPFISTAAKIWINSYLVKEFSIIGTNSSSHKGNIGNISLPIPQGENKITITIQSSNYNYEYYGPVIPIISESGYADNQVKMVKAWTNFFAGSLVALTIIHIFLFALYTKEKPYLLLALICLAVAMRALIYNKGSFFLPELLPNIEFIFWKKLEYIAVYSILIFFPLYIHFSFIKKTKTQLVYVLAGIGAVFSIIPLFTSFPFFSGILDYAHVLFVVEFIYAGVVLYNNRGSAESQILLYGLLASTPIILLELLTNSNVIYIPFNNMVELAVLIFFLFQSFLLARKNAKAFKWAEQLNQNLEVQVADRTKDLQISNQIKDSLISIISHDLKSPINSLKGVLNLMKLGYTSAEENQNMMGHIEGEMENVNCLLDNLLYWYSTQSKGIRISKTEINLNETISNHIILFNQPCINKNIKIDLNICANASIWADKDIVSLAIRNLVSNAIKFTPKNGIIKLSTLNYGDTIHLTIKDTGVGMDENKIKEILHSEPLSTPGTQNEKGHGLGLALTRKFLFAMGAKIKVSSKPNYGTEFTIFLESYKNQEISEDINQEIKSLG
jgi:signal transduction histidine kinase